MGEKIATNTMVPVAVKRRPSRRGAKPTASALVEKGIAASSAGMQTAAEGLPE
jgi:hypothetical protein